MIPLHDSVQFLTRATGEPTGDPIPAHVGTPRSGSPENAGGIGHYTGVALVVILEPGSGYDPAAHDVQWRGEAWTQDGQPTHSRRYGRDHHVTIPLKRVVVT